MCKMCTMGGEDVHREFGIHSNIPECCITWWYRECLSTHTVPSKLRFDPGPAVGYARCPECIKHKRFQVLHHCSASNPSCHKWLPFCEGDRGKIRPKPSPEERKRLKNRRRRKR